MLLLSLFLFIITSSKAINTYILEDAIKVFNLKCVITVNDLINFVEARDMLKSSKTMTTFVDKETLNISRSVKKLFKNQKCKLTHSRIVIQKLFLVYYFASKPHNFLAKKYSKTLIKSYYFAGMVM